MKRKERFLYRKIVTPPPTKNINKTLKGLFINKIYNGKEFYSKMANKIVHEQMNQPNLKFLVMNLIEKIDLSKDEIQQIKKTLAYKEHNL